MKVVDLSETEEFEEALGKEEGLASVNWRDTPEEVLDQIDHQLKEFGLEIQMYDVGGQDTILWKIVKRS